LCCSVDQVEEVEMVVACSTCRRRRKTQTRLWWGNLIERLFGRPRCRWEYTIKMDLKETGREGVRVINLAFERASDELLSAR